MSQPHPSQAVRFFAGSGSGSGCGGAGGAVSRCRRPLAARTGVCTTLDIPLAVAPTPRPRSRTELLITARGDRLRLRDVVFGPASACCGSCDPSLLRGRPMEGGQKSLNMRSCQPSCPGPSQTAMCSVWCRVMSPEPRATHDLFNSCYDVYVCVCRRERRCEAARK